MERIRDEFLHRAASMVREGEGFFTVNTSGTKGFVRFSDKLPHQLGEVTLKTDNEFAVILVTSLDKENGIDKASRILVTTIARAQNTGMKYNDDHTQLIKRGDAPILLEPVNLSLKIDRNEKPAVTVLDHSGRKTARILAPKNGWINLDGAANQAIYYLIEF